MGLNLIIILTTSICSMVGIVYLVYKGIDIMLNNQVGREFR